MSHPLQEGGVGGSRYAPSRGRKSGFSIAPLSPGFYPYTVHHNYSLLVTQDCRRLGKPRGRRLRSCTGVAVRGEDRSLVPIKTGPRYSANGFIEKAGQSTKGT